MRKEKKRKEKEKERKEKKKKVESQVCLGSLKMARAEKFLNFDEFFMSMN